MGPSRRSQIAVLAMLLAGLLAADSRASSEPPLSDAEALETLREAESNHDLGIELLATRPEEARAAFALAAAGFESVLDRGVHNAGLHYNLANALLRSGDRGGAIVEYLRAQTLDPADPAIAANLAFARSQVPGRPTRGEDPSIAVRLATWWHVLPLRVRAIAAISAWLVFWTLLVVRQSGLAGDLAARRNLWNAALASTLIAAVVLGATVGLDLRDRLNSDGAVLIDDEVVLRKGNGEGFAPESVSPLASGTECRVLEQRPGWTRIALEDGRSGWVPAPSIERVVDAGG